MDEQAEPITEPVTEPLTEERRARVLIVDNSVRLLCQTQQPENGGRAEDAGGFRCPERLCCEPQWAADALWTLGQVRREPLSHFHGSDFAAQRMAGALAFLRRVQRADGAFEHYGRGELPSTAVTAEIALRLAPMAAEGGNALRELLHRAGQALLHRPAPAAPHSRLQAAVALLELHALAPDPAFEQRAQTYLSDGVAPNTDGLYPDRNAPDAFATNALLLRLAALTGDETHTDSVRRSLDFWLHNVHENGEIPYQFSTHLETATPKLKLGGATVWAAMARRDQNGVYAHMADATLAGGHLTLAEAARRNQAEVAAWTWTSDPDSLTVAHPQESKVGELSRRGEMLFHAPDIASLPRAPLPTVYHQTYAASRLARAREGKKSATLMAMQPNFLSLHNRGVVLEGLRVLANVGGWKPLRPRDFDAFGQYLYRFRAETDDGTATMDITAEVRADAVSLSLDIEGGPRLPIQMELAWRPEGMLVTGDARRYDLPATRRPIVTDQPLRVTSGVDTITVTGLPPTDQRYFDDTQPWFSSIPIVRVIAPFFAPASLSLEFGLI